MAKLHLFQGYDYSPIIDEEVNTFELQIPKIYISDPSPMERAPSTSGPRLVGAAAGKGEEEDGWLGQVVACTALE